MALLLSVNAGLPQDVAWRGRTVHTGVWKHPVAGRRRVRRLNLDGDGQGDLVGHGGEQRAVLVYQIESYRYWERELGRTGFTYGQFGENFTVSDWPDDEVCIGDRYRIGSAVFEVTQPRVTCYRVGIRMGEPRMAALLVAHHRPGFYLRVLQEGEVGAGDAIVKIADGPQRMSVTEADALLYLEARHPDPAKLERALRIDAFSPGWKASFRAMADVAQGIGWPEDNAFVLSAGSHAAWPGFRALRVAEARQLARDVIGIELVSDDPAVQPVASAGQFIALRLPVGGADAVAIRSYSLTDTSRAGHYPIAVKCEAGGVAGNWLREHVQVGTALDVAAPRGGFVLRDGVQPVVLLSAGIGVTPVLAMLRALVAQRSTRLVGWIHCARNGDEHPLAAEARALLDELAHARRLIVYSRPLPTDRVGDDFDLAGRLTARHLLDFGIAPDADVYLCGPDAFMRDMHAALAAVPIAPTQIRTERFGTLPSITPGVVPQPHRPPHRLAQEPGQGPRVTFARSGVDARWDGRFASLLELAEACNVPVRWACRTGVCHTCITRLLGGSVAYHVEPLDRPDADDALICCSHPDGDVVLDL